MYATPEWQKGDTSLKEASQAINKIIDTALTKNTGALIGRQGSIELEAVLTHVLSQGKNPLNSARQALLETNAGIFPVTDTTVMETWRIEYLDSLQNADALAVGWFAQLADLEQKLLKAVQFSGIPIPLRTLEPYYLPKDLRWTKLFTGHRVTLVSSFTETMKAQLPNLKNGVWNGGDPTGISDAASVEFVRSFYSPVCAEGNCEWPETVKNCIDAINYLENQIVLTNPRFVLLGCGGIGMPLALRLKKRGIIAIVVGGAIQIFFGIKGKRWANHPIISGFWNDSWVEPSTDEIPNGAKKVEGACYW
jgi:hypothetical protein